MHFDEFKSVIKNKPRILTQRAYDHTIHEHGSNTWLLLKTGNDIKFFSMNENQHNTKEEFSAYCTQNDKVRCTQNPDGYSLEIEYHVSGERRFSTFFFSE